MARQSTWTKLKTLALTQAIVEAGGVVPYSEKEGVIPSAIHGRLNRASKNHQEDQEVQDAILEARRFGRDNYDFSRQSKYTPEVTLAFIAEVKRAGGVPKYAEAQCISKSAVWGRLDRARKQNLDRSDVIEAIEAIKIIRHDSTKPMEPNQ